MIRQPLDLETARRIGRVGSPGLTLWWILAIATASKESK